jgi:hypothetical protein
MRRSSACHHPKRRRSRKKRHSAPPIQQAGQHPSRSVYALTRASFQPRRPDSSRQRPSCRTVAPSQPSGVTCPHYAGRMHPRGQHHPVMNMRQRPTTHDAERAPPREGGATYMSDASTPSPSTVDEPPDDINGLVQALALDYVSACSWTYFVEKFRGKEGDLHPQVKRLPRAVADFLEDLRVTGAKVTLSTPKWKMAQKEAALARGPPVGQCPY